MKVISHGTKVACTEYDDTMINATLADRDGNLLELFFDSVDDLKLLTHELQCLAADMEEEVAA